MVVKLSAQAPGTSSQLTATRLTSERLHGNGWGEGHVRVRGSVPLQPPFDDGGALGGAFAAPRGVGDALRPWTAGVWESVRPGAGRRGRQLQAEAAAPLQLQVRRAHVVSPTDTHRWQAAGVNQVAYGARRQVEDLRGCRHRRISRQACNRAFHT